MPMYNLIEYSDNYSKTLWQYCRDEPALANNCDITDFNANNADSNSFKIKEKITGQTGNNGTKNVETILSLEYLSNFWINPEMSLINYEISLELNWSEYCVIVPTNTAAQAITFSITDTDFMFQL